VVKEDKDNMAMENVPFIEAEPTVIVDKAHKTSRYWVGVRAWMKEGPGGMEEHIYPFFFDHVCGITFPHETGRLGKDPSRPGSRTVVSRTPGQVVELTDDQVEEIKQVVARRTVRLAGKARRSSIYNVNDPYYTPQEGDEPLSRYIYMKKLDENQQGVPIVPPLIGED